MKIAVLPGDGIGPEIIAATVLVLQALGPRFNLETAPVGGAAYDFSGHPLPPATLALAQSANAILFGAVGDWKYDTLPRELRPEQAILGLRKHLGLFANFRPAICYPELTAASSLKPEIIGGLDILIVRELNGDIYFGSRAVFVILSTLYFQGCVRVLIPCITASQRWSELVELLLKLPASAVKKFAVLIKLMY